LGGCSRAPFEEVISPFLPSVAVPLFSRFDPVCGETLAATARWNLVVSGPGLLRRSRQGFIWVDTVRGSGQWCGSLFVRGSILFALRLDLKETDPAHPEIGWLLGFRWADLGFSE
jgi:hypothetical protein